MKPTVGRIVHFYLDLSERYVGIDPLPLPAIIIRAKEAQVIQDKKVKRLPVMEVDLQVFGLDERAGFENIPYSEQPLKGHWTWPPRD